MTAPAFGSEYDFTRAIVDLAMWRRWSVFHQLPAMTKRGARSAVMGHVGFPDLVLARGGVILFRELKLDRGQLTPEQRDWGKQLGNVWAVWRPADWDLIQRTLAARWPDEAPSPGNDP